MYENLGLRKFGVKDGKSVVRIHRVHVDRLAEIVLEDGRFVSIYRPTIDDIVHVQSYNANAQKVVLIHLCCDFDDERIPISEVSNLDWGESRVILAYLDQAMKPKK